jgi:hypothetical protein
MSTREEGTIMKTTERIGIAVSALAVATLGIIGCGAGVDADSDEVGLEREALSVARNVAKTCAIQTINGHYLTAVGGGGHDGVAFDVLHTDATQVSAWETFTLVDTGEGGPTPFGIRTVRGLYLTANDGGGRINQVMRSNASTIRAWERFGLVALGGNSYGIETVDGHYLTAVDGGGRIADTIHSDANSILAWEQFQLHCNE